VLAALGGSLTNIVMTTSLFFTQKPTPQNAVIRARPLLKREGNNFGNVQNGESDLTKAKRKIVTGDNIDVGAVSVN
jgi:hypothetical protein